MNKCTWTIRLAITLFFASRVLFTQLPRIMAQTTDTPCASSVPSSQAFGYANTSSAATSSGNEESTTSESNQNDWVHAWMRKADEARASQPHFVSPIVTTHVMLVQQYRFDMSWQQDPTGGKITSNYGASRGLEIIPASRFEIGLFQPPYLVHESSVQDGFGDFSFQIKYRAFSAPEGQGDYFAHSTERCRSHRLVSHLRGRQGH